ncbi:hypothetical protein BB558_005337 [Smittium angustum]|nr:hypothetical protein BB558_005337 [Smittium angustum]
MMHSRRSALSRTRAAAIRANIMANNSNNAQNNLLPVRNIFPTANITRINIVKKKKVILSEDLESYPVVTMKDYKKSTSIKIPEKALEKNNTKFSLSSSTHEPETSTNDRVECLICIEEFKDDDLIRIIPCYHPFHKHCIDTWLLEQSGFCPTCRLDLRLTPENEIENQNEFIDTIQQPNDNQVLYITTNQITGLNDRDHWVGNSNVIQRLGINRL